MEYLVTDFEFILYTSGLSIRSYKLHISNMAFVFWRIVRFLVVLCSVCYQVAAFNVTLLHTNDIHGRVKETDKYGRYTAACSDKGDCYGGFARLATAVKRARAKYNNVLLFDAADRFAGTVWSEYYKGEATAVMMNTINYTATTLGNHDFDFGLAPLARFVANTTRTPMVVSNLNIDKEPSWKSIDKLILNHATVFVGGEKVGIVGYLIESIKSHPFFGDNLEVLPIISSVQKAVDALQAAGVNKIIALGHAGFAVDKAVAAKVKGVDVVVGGHSHLMMCSGPQPSTDKCREPYPLMIHQKHNASLTVPVVQAFSFTKYLGQLHVTFDDQGVVTRSYGNPILLDSTVEKDREMAAKVSRMESAADHIFNGVVGKTKILLDAANCSKKPCVLGHVMTSAMLYHFRSRNSTIALFHSNSIYESLASNEKGDILYKSLFDSFPYRNTIDLIELTGKDIEESLKYPNTVQIQGLKVDESSSGKEVMVAYPCPTNDCFKPLDPTRVYKVIVNSYLANGGNKVITAHAKAREYGPSTYDVMLEYLKNNSPIGGDKDDPSAASRALLRYCTPVLSLIFWSFFHSQ